MFSFLSRTEKKKTKKTNLLNSISYLKKNFPIIGLEKSNHSIGFPVDCCFVDVERTVKSSVQV